MHRKKSNKTGHDNAEYENETKRLEPEAVVANPYEVLELERSATAADIKKAYFQKVREHPPERDPQAFKRIRAAYDALRTPEARTATDLFMLHPPTAYEPYKRPPTLKTDYTPADWQAALRAQTDLSRDNFKQDFRDIDL
jgi:curved DNA-binding protein CbpA